jgi:glutamine amidotransferase/cyclase
LIKDVTNIGFDIELINHIRNNASIPVIAYSGAGKVEHFSEVFEKTDVEAALAAGIFHREEVPIEAVKEHMQDRGIETR